MPTKTVRPRWGFTAPGFQPSILFTRAEVSELASLVGKSSTQDVAQLHELLNDEGAMLHGAKYLDEYQVSSAETKAALRIITRAAEKMLWYFENLDPTTRGIVIGLYQYHQIAGLDREEQSYDERYRRDIEHFRRLVSVVQFCKRKWKVERGKPGIGMVQYYARSFAEIYEMFTGMRFEAPRSIKADREPALEFVRKTVRKLAPRATETNINTALRYAAKALRDKTGAG